MIDVRQGDPKITVRSYDPVDEMRRHDLPRLLEGDPADAFRLAQELLPSFHVLWQEAVPVKETLFCGNILILPDGTGTIEAAHGQYEVRQVNNVLVPDGDRIRTNVGPATEVEPGELAELLSRAQRAARLLRQRQGVSLAAVSRMVN